MPILVALLGAGTAGAISTCPLAGTGTSADPFLVATYGELDSVGTYCDLSKTFRLTADIDASPSATENSGHGFRPIGNGASAFTGTFQGAGHAISNLFIADSTDSAVGLFAILGSGSIDSLVLKGSRISGGATGDSGSIGGIVGINAGGSILHCQATDDTLDGARDSAAVGGMVGRNRGTVSDSRSKIVVTGGAHGFAGGIAGQNVDTIRASRASGTVSGADSSAIGGVAGSSTGYMTLDTSDAQVSGSGTWPFVGGLVGLLDDSLTQSVATGPISASDFGASGGGAVGYVDTFGTIASVWATGDITGGGAAQSLGGLAGHNVDSAGSISGCWASGSVNGNSSSNLGGLVGLNDKGGSVFASYAVGNVAGLEGSNAGGLVGQNNGLVDRGYTTGKVSGFGNDAGVGGVVGWNQHGTLLNSYSTGYVVGGQTAAGKHMWVGGVVGSNNSVMKDVYFSGRIDSFTGGGHVFIGGVAGQSANGLSSVPQVTEAYWDVQTSGLSHSFGDSSISGASDTATGLTTAQMLDGSNFAGFLFDPDTGWKIALGKTYPALSGLTNAPFALPDSLLMDSTGLVLSRLLANDTDAEISTPSLVAVVDTVMHGSLATFANSTAGSLDTLMYRVGAVISAGDTLWGGEAPAALELVRFRFALGADSLHHYGDTAFTLSATVVPALPTVYASQDSTVVSLTGTRAQPGKVGHTTLTATVGGELVQTAAVRVAPKVLTVAGASATSKVYDGTTTVSASGGTLSGVVGSEAVTLSGGNWVFATKDAGTNKPVVLRGATLTGADAANYVLDTVGATASISRLTVTITGATAQSKVYDGTAAATVTGAVLADTVAGDTIHLDLGTATFPDKSADTGRTVTLSGTKLTGADSADYVLGAAPSLKADISRKPLTISGATAQDKVYDGTAVDTVTGAVLADTVAGDTVHLVLGAATFADKRVGAHKTVTVATSSLSGADSADYSLTQLGTLSASITRRTATITGATAQTKVYDGSKAATVTGASLSGVVSGDTLSLVLSTASFADKGVGTGRPVTLSGTSLAGADTGDYTLGALPALAANITVKPVTISNATAQDKVYDGTNAATVTGAILADTIAGDAVGLTLGTATFDTKDVGTGKTVTVTGSTLSGPDAGDYSLTQPGSLHASITAKSLEIVAKNDSIPLNGTPTLTFAENGLLTGDSITGKLGSSNNGTGTAGTYDITQGTLSAGPDYTISFVGASLIIHESAALASLPVSGFSPAISHELATNVGQAFAPPAVGSGRAELGTGPVSGGQGAQTVDILLTGPGTVSVAIYDNLGTLVIAFSRDIAQMDLNYLEATKDGRWILPLSWNLRAENGIAVPTGVYLWKIDVQTVDGKKLDTVKKLGVREIR